ncbi:hypothetical protein H112_00431 [Trichophyton rubrum D6]|uniref:Methyltransferase domain-containing protein n=4 Tax=Trichophyton TaxID=5550 RepID=A0A178F8G8_TRIRU|nr:uncharacterized protein TERG_08047 [Trichophyton rubrum CBS 118892]EZF27589.1 hypothetical protein H100_00430 [Trichophyton rubrum MR850]EZF46624.1 hypothetical protein H102_00430 [Trichophyton rubrum CBS 100081]EZF57287.1 hypothetical protein H103_00430 [Trichophyton rubrum CBS 288.86]EZF67884.1 hypothetical protein H104_00420 [Trichophyton rubrum CBS 289.86]EZF78502.1 hypothetical protein H105_00419 [Trichophyton soudanense CBS 452.61]EZF89139.1 hypothetical protein H110_00434 [Trichophy
MAIETTSFYSSPYLAELYELQWAGPNMTDVELYAKAFMDAVTKNRTNHPVTFLELGTGSGRVILGVLKRMAEASYDTSNIKMIGLDNSQNMLDMAAKMETKTKGISPPVTWTLGDALELDQLPIFLPRADEHTTVDFLTFPLSSIVHMVEDGQLERLLQQIGKVLTPGTGRAYISLFNWFLIRPDDDLQARKDDEVLPPPTGFPSAEFPSIQYHSEMKKSKYQGDLVIYRQEVQVFEQQDNCEKKEIERYYVTQTLRWFSENALLAAVEAAGLQVVERRMENTGIHDEESTDFVENIFILKRCDC